MCLVAYTNNITNICVNIYVLILKINKKKWEPAAHVHILFFRRITITNVFNLSRFACKLVQINVMSMWRTKAEAKKRAEERKKK